MANTYNKAELWEPQILEAMAEGTFAAKYITSNVKWLNADTFNFTTMATGGYGNHTANTWNTSVITQANVAYQLDHDRDVEFQVDKRFVDETNSSASAANVTKTFIAEHANPELDAIFFGKVSEVAIANSLSIDETPAVGTIYSLLKASLAKVRRYRKEQEVFISSEDMDLLERSSELTRKIEFTQVAQGGLALETRITAIDGTPIIEVTDPERFYTTPSYSDDTNAGEVGFDGDVAESSPINYIITDKARCSIVPKINSIYFFAPGTHTKGDGWLYQNRSLSDAFVFPDGHRGIKSIYLSFDMRELTVTSVAGTSTGDTLITLDTLIGNTDDYSYVYKTHATVAPTFDFGSDLSTWTAWTYGDDITATTGHKITVAVVDEDDLAVSGGNGTVTSKA
ncbi:phage capsid protein [Candidatus Bathyarchaeota archaeon]|nr:MAG: phage capsid protein [Candidatus Bathyarchaeota archaeon]